MKLRFKVVKRISKKNTDLEENIKLALSNLHYTVTESTKKEIVFKDVVKNGVYMLRSGAFTKVDDGKFEIVENGLLTCLKLTYTISTTEIVILTLSLILISPFIDYFLCFGAVFFLIIFLFQLLFSYTKWNNIVSELVE